MLLLVYYMFSSLNSYNTLFYLFLQLIICGLFLAIYQVELFTAFLWVIEFTVILVCILLLFYLNVSGINYFNIYYSYIKQSILYVILFLFISFIVPFKLPEDIYIYNFTSFFILWENYYETLYLISANDVLSLTISYYTINNLELVLIGFILLIGSVICVNFNKMQRLNRNKKINDQMNIFNIFNFLSNNIFMRRQNMVYQNLTKAVLKIFKRLKKKKNVKITKED